MKPTKRTKITVFDIFNNILMLFILLSCLAPLLHVLFSSMSDPIKLAAKEGLVIHPLGFSLKGYELVFKNPNILRSYLNTIFYVASATLIGLLLTALGGYVLSRKGLVLRNAFMLIIIFTMFFNGGLIPFYMVVRALGMRDTVWALIVPTCLSAFNLIIMRTSMQSLPASIEDSAKIDGAGHLTLLFRIILPLSKATLAVIALFYAVGHWNSWFNASIFIDDRKLYPLQLILREILIQNDTGSMMKGTSIQERTDLYKPLVKYCTIIVATLPLLCFYPFAQKYFVKGVMIGAIKG